MDDRIPPHPSEAMSLSDDDSASSFSMSDVSMMNLSRQFDRHSLQSRRQNQLFESPTFQACDFHPSQLSNHNPTAFNSSQVVLQQRQQMTRHPCNHSNLSRTHTMGLLSDGQPRSSYFGASMSANTTSPLSPLEEDTLPPLQSSCRDPNSASSPGFFSENEESDSSRGDARRYLHQRVHRDLRHSLSREGIGKQKVVLKSIRFRKSFQKKRALEEKKWQNE